MIPALLKAGKKPRPELWKSNAIFFEVFYALDAYRSIDGMSGMLGPIDPRLLDWWIDKNRGRLTPRQITEIPLFVPRLDVKWRAEKNRRQADRTNRRRAEQEQDDD